MELKPALRDAPSDLPVRIDADALALGCNYTFTTLAGDLNLLGHVEPLGDFEQLAKSAIRLTIEGMSIRVIALEDLIRVKQTLNRPKDREALTHLLAIRRVRENQRTRTPRPGQAGD